MSYLISVIGTITVLALIGSIIFEVQNRRVRKTASERRGANICEYARSFEYRKVDTKIMRAVWNELQEYLQPITKEPYPIYTDDSLEKTCYIDPDDIDDIYLAVADELGISTEDPEINPYWDKVNTVKDLVLFLNNQPRLANA